MKSVQISLICLFASFVQTFWGVPKLSEKGQNLTVAIVLHRAVKILSGFGLSMNGQHVFCGDYLYSGHTMTFVLAYLIIMECKFFQLFQISPMKGSYIGMKIVEKYSSK